MAGEIDKDPVFLPPASYLFLLEWYTDLYVWRASKNMNMKAVV